MGRQYLKPVGHPCFTGNFPFVFLAFIQSSGVYIKGGSVFCYINFNRRGSAISCFETDFLQGFAFHHGKFNVGILFADEYIAVLIPIEFVGRMECEGITLQSISSISNTCATAAGEF